MPLFFGRTISIMWLLPPCHCGRRVGQLRILGRKPSSRRQSPRFRLRLHHNHSPSPLSSRFSFKFSILTTQRAFFPIQQQPLDPNRYHARQLGYLKTEVLVDFWHTAFHGCVIDLPGGSLVSPSADFLCAALRLASMGSGARIAPHKFSFVVFSHPGSR